MTSTLISKLFLITLLLVFLTSCTTEPESVKIGVLVDLTGPAAFFGEDELRAFQLAIDEENSKGSTQFKLVVEDSHFDTTQSITALKKLVYVDNVPVILGPTWDMPAVSQAANEEKVVMIADSNTPGVEQDQNLPYIFSTLFSVRRELSELSKFSKTKNINKVVILRDTDLFSQVISTLFKQAASTNLLIVDELTVLTGETDFKTTLLKIGLESTDAIFYTFATEEQKPLIIKQLYELGWRKPLLSVSSSESPTLLKNAGQYLKEIPLYYAVPQFDQSEFLAKFRQKYNMLPTSPVATNAYDAANIAISALKNTDGSPEKIKDYLMSNTFPSITFGTLKFDEIGHVDDKTSNYIIKTARENQFIRVETDENKNNFISWEDAIEILNQGKVSEVMQAHSLSVTLILKDGTSLRTVEPSIDDIFDEVQKCGDICKNTVLATE